MQIKMEAPAIECTSLLDQNDINETNWRNKSSKKLENKDEFLMTTGSKSKSRKPRREQVFIADSLEYGNACLKQAVSQKEQNRAFDNKTNSFDLSNFVGRFAGFSDGNICIPQMTAMNSEYNKREIRKKKSQLKPTSPNDRDSFSTKVKQHSTYTKPSNPKYTSDRKEIKPSPARPNVPNSYITQNEARKASKTKPSISDRQIRTSPVRRAIAKVVNNGTVFDDIERIVSPVPTETQAPNQYPKVKGPPAMSTPKECRFASASPVPTNTKAMTEYPKVKESSVMSTPTASCFTSTPSSMKPVYISTPICERSSTPNNLDIKMGTSPEFANTVAAKIFLGYEENSFRRKFTSVGRDVGGFIGDVVRDGVTGVGGMVGALIGEGSDRFIEYMNTPTKVESNSESGDLQMVEMSENAGNMLGSACGKVIHSVEELIERPENVMTPELMNNLKENINKLPGENAFDSWIGDPNICYNEVFTKSVIPKEGLLDAMDVIMTIDDAQRASANIYGTVKETLPDVQELSSDVINIARKSIVSAKESLPPLIEVGKSMDRAVNNVYNSVDGFTDTMFRSVNGFGSNFMEGLNCNRKINRNSENDYVISHGETRSLNKCNKDLIEDTYGSWKRKV